MVKTTKLFKSPPGFPNGIAVAPEEIGPLAFEKWLCPEPAVPTQP